MKAMVTKCGGVADRLVGAIFLLQFSVLTAVRPGEARYMVWAEWDEKEGLWILPWQRTKEGRKIRRDHIIVLSDPATEILTMLREQQRRDKIEIKYVFGNFLDSSTAAVPGSPPAAETLRKLLRYLLGEIGEQHATMHGFRTTFRSWAEEKGYIEKDAERALGHVKGFGETEVSRLYSRKSKRRGPIQTMMDHWARVCLEGEPGGDVIPFRQSK